MSFYPSFWNVFLPVLERVVMSFDGYLELLDMGRTKTLCNARTLLSIYILEKQVEKWRKNNPAGHLYQEKRNKGGKKELKSESATLDSHPSSITFSPISAHLLSSAKDAYRMHRREWGRFGETDFTWDSAWDGKEIDWRKWQSSLLQLWVKIDCELSDDWWTEGGSEPSMINITWESFS